MISNQLTVLLIVAMIVLASIVNSSHVHRRRKRGDRDDTALGEENARLREEMKRMQERISVLERITVEKENSLERRIEELRDR